MGLLVVVRLETAILFGQFRETLADLFTTVAVLQNGNACEERRRGFGRAERPGLSLVTHGVAGANRLELRYDNDVARVRFGERAAVAFANRIEDGADLVLLRAGDDVKVGTEALHRMMALEHDPGSWAAVVLASRGEKATMIKAIELIAVPRDYSRRAAIHDNLIKRLLVLLSNVAAQSGIPQPPAPAKEYAESQENDAILAQFAEDLKTWWRTHEDKIVLRDPWLELLEKQKVD